MKYHRKSGTFYVMYTHKSHVVFTLPNSGAAAFFKVNSYLLQPNKKRLNLKDSKQL